MAVTVSDLLLTDRAEGVLTLTLNRPERLNALSPDLLHALHEALAAAAADEEVRSVILTGAGRAFSAGADLVARNEDGHHHRSTRERLREDYVPVITALREMDKPVIAAVNGVAAGAGASLALACDLRVAGESASFIQAFVRIGLIPDAGATFFLPRLVGLGRAMEMALLGDTVSAAAALAAGLVNRVVPDDMLTSEAQALALRLARGPRAVGLIKRALNTSTTHDLATQLWVEEDLQAEASASADFAEGVTAFVEKRPPAFGGR